MAKNVIIHGVTYADVPRVDIPLANGGGDAAFWDVSEAAAVPGDVKSGVKFGGSNGVATGTMPRFEDGADSGDISTAAGSVTIAAGYHDGDGSVGIAAAERAKIVSGNIKNGVTLLGVSGKNTVVDTEISASAAGAGQIATGYKAYVNGSMITGTMSEVTVSQDSVTKVLTIS